MDFIPNDQLLENDIPTNDSDYETIANFASTLDPETYTEFYGLSSPNSKSLTLTELRVHLLAFQRIHHHWGYGPSNDELLDAINLVQRIREKVIKKEFD